MTRDPDNNTDALQPDAIDAPDGEVTPAADEPPDVWQCELSPIDGDEERAGTRPWTFYATITSKRKDMNPLPFDHKWESTCTVEGHVIDKSGSILQWNHVAIGYNRGCQGAYPKAEVIHTRQAVQKIKDSCSLRPKIDHWSGWAEFRNDQGVARFHWKTKNCP